MTARARPIHHATWRRVRSEAAALVRFEANGAVARRHAQMLAEGWDDGEAWDAVVEWSARPGFIAYANQRLGEVTRSLIEPNASSVVLQ